MKKIATILLGIVISVMIFSNIWTQFNTLKEARKQNYDMEQKISKLEEENQLLSQNIAYATCCAFLEGEARDKLGLGKENDIWVKVGAEKDLNLFPTIQEAKKIPNIKQWISLFTR